MLSLFIGVGIGFISGFIFTCYKVMDYLHHCVDNNELIAEKFRITIEE